MWMCASLVHIHICNYSWDESICAGVRTVSIQALRECAEAFKLAGRRLCLASVNHYVSVRGRGGAGDERG